MADYDLDPQVPSPDSSDWEVYNRDTSWQSEGDGIINFDVRYTRNFSVELEGVQGVGWNNLYYSHYDYPNSSMNTYDAQLVFHFDKGDRDLFFTTYGSLLEDTARHWFVLSKITNGIARCPGKEKAWRFRVEDPKAPPRLRRAAASRRPARP